MWLFATIAILRQHDDYRDIIAIRAIFNILLKFFQGAFLEHIAERRARSSFDLEKQISRCDAKYPSARFRYRIFILARNQPVTEITTRSRSFRARAALAYLV